MASVEKEAVCLTGALFLRTRRTAWELTLQSLCIDSGKALTGVPIPSGRRAGRGRLSTGVPPEVSSGFLGASIMSAAREKQKALGEESASKAASPLSLVHGTNLPGRGVPAETAADKPRLFARVPTHSFGMALERRFHPRAALRLPLRLTEVNHVAEPVPITLLTKNISSSGVYFLAPKPIEPGTAIELEVGLVERPLGRGGVRMRTVAHVVRAEEAQEPGWEERRVG